MSNKERWQKLAGIINEEADEESGEDTETLQEGFKNLGMASPGIMGGNPFERSGNRHTPATNEDYRVTGRPDSHGPLGESLMQAEELLEKIIGLAEKYDLSQSPDGGSACEELIDEIRQFLNR